MFQIKKFESIWNLHALTLARTNGVTPRPFLSRGATRLLVENVTTTRRFFFFFFLRVHVHTCIFQRLTNMPTAIPIYKIFNHPDIISVPIYFFEYLKNKS